MPFSNPVVAGNILVIPAIRSPNFQTGVAGWIIRRDGSAEFANIVISNGELFIQDPDGSYVRVFDQNPGAGALIQLRPADVVGHTIDNPAEVFTTASVSGAHLVLAGPEFDGISGPSLFLGVSSGDVVADLTADDLISLETDRVMISSANNTPGLEIYPNQSASTRLELDAKELGFHLEGADGSNGGATFDTTSASFVTVTGAPTDTYVKKQASTRTKITHIMTMAATATGTAYETAIRLNTTDYRTGLMTCSNAGTTDQPLLVGGVVMVAGLAAGSYSITPRVRRTVGAGTIRWHTTNSFCSFTVEEVIEA